MIWPRRGESEGVRHPGTPGGARVRFAATAAMGALALCAATCIVASGPGAGRPRDPLAAVEVDTSPLRGEFRPLRLRRRDGTGFVYRCMECHKSLGTASRVGPLLAEHTDIRLEHGRNDYCLNCHHPTDRDAYVNHDGTPISSDTPALLCAKCHGIVYRDWESGAHGRSGGYWDARLGERRRLLCIQCHDPHAPRIRELKPLPGPRLPGVASGHGEEAHR